MKQHSSHAIFNAHLAVYTCLHVQKMNLIPSAAKIRQKTDVTSMIFFADSRALL